MKKKKEAHIWDVVGTKPPPNIKIGREEEGSGRPKGGSEKNILGKFHGSIAPACVSRQRTGRVQKEKSVSVEMLNPRMFPA